MTVFDATTLHQLRGAYRFEKNIPTLAATFNLSLSSTYRYARLGFQSPNRARRATPAAVTARRALIKEIAKKQRTTGKGRTFKEFSSAAQIGLEMARRQKGNKSSPTASLSTIIRDAHVLKLSSKMRRKLCSRELVHVEKRQAFKTANERRNWRTIVHSDETWLSTKERTGAREWCEQHEQPNPIEDKGRRNLDSFQVFAAVGWNYKSPLIIFPKERITYKKILDRRFKKRTYRTKVIKTAFRVNSAEYMERSLGGIKSSLKQHQAYLKSKRMTMLFQEDGARCHTSGDVATWFHDEKIKRLPDFPPYSPDLNMIEKVWKLLHAAIGKRCPESEEELIEAAQAAWDHDITQEVINKCCEHFSKAVAAI